MDYNVYEELSKLNESLPADSDRPFVAGVYDLEYKVFMAAADTIMKEICAVLNASEEEIVDITGVDFRRNKVFEAIMNRKITNYVENILGLYRGEMQAREAEAADREARVKEVRSVFPDMYDEKGNLLPPKEDKKDQPQFGKLTDDEIDLMQDII